MYLLIEIACDHPDTTRLPLYGTVGQQCPYAQNIRGLDQANLASIDRFAERRTEIDTTGKSSISLDLLCF
jgi:hypothetical protein